MVALLAGLWGALALLGIDVPAQGITAADHGMLMSLGFLGTVISVERAVALARPWAWAAPALAGVSTVWLLTQIAPHVGKALLLASGVLLAAIYVALHHVQPSLHNTLMGVGALGWVAAVAFWLADWDIGRLLGWLSIFLVVTIVAERLELSRLIGATRVSRSTLTATVAAVVVGSLVSVWHPATGFRIAGAGLVGMAVWLGSYDVARRTVRMRGVTRFMAAGLLAGYAWLAAAGVVWLVVGFRGWGASFDVQIHALFLGFVMSMVFAHAPVIAPAVLRRPMRYTPLFYVHLGLLHLSLLIRILGGDAAGNTLAWRVGGVLNEIAILAFLGVTAAAVVAGSRARKRVPAPEGAPVATRVSDAATGARRGNVRTAATVVGSAAVGALLVLGSLAIANRGGDSTATAQVTPNGQTRTVSVELLEMHIVPSTISVQAGTRLVLEVTNTGTMQHDLRLSSGVQTPMLDPGHKATLDAGVIGKKLDGWCTVPGHRAAGMNMTITATPASAASTPPAAVPPMADMPGMGASSSNGPPPDWKPIDPVLSPAPTGATVHKVTWHMRDVTTSVAPGVTQRMWTFGGTVPGPVLHGRVGDTFEVTVVNDTAMSHSIDFHAESGPPAAVMRPVLPGGQTTYRFTATHAGAWLYHCGVEPMLLHLGNGMYGALIVEPPNLPPVAQQYVFVGSEFFFGAQGGIGDYQKMLADTPDTMAFNGYPFAYQFRPIAAPVGKTVRVWVIDAGPSRALSFHVIGAPFSSVFLDGGYLVRPGDPARGAGQTLPVMPGDGGFVELTFTRPGDYPFMTHVLADAAKGAAGMFRAS